MILFFSFFAFYRSKIVKVHESPTPSKRSTDYADLDSIRPAPSTIGTMSLNFTDSVVSTDQMNGHHFHHPRQGQHYPGGNQFMPNNQTGHHHYPHEHFPPQNVGPSNPRFDADSVDGSPSPPHDIAIQAHHMSSGSMSQRFVDTLTRVHTPPPAIRETPEHTSPPTRLSPPHNLHSQTGLSQDEEEDDDETWNPANHLNYKGHMSNKPVSRSNSGRSTQSSASFEKVNMSNFSNDLRHKRKQLSPLHENGHMGRHDAQPQAMSMQELHSRSRAMSNHVPHVPEMEDHTARMHRAQSMDPNFGMKVRNRQPPVGMEMKQLPPLATEVHHMRDFNPMEHEQQFGSIPPPPSHPPPHGMMENPHQLHQSRSPVPDPHVVEYGLDPPVHLSFSHSIQQQDHHHQHHSSRGQRPVNFYPANEFPPHEHPPHPSQHYPMNEKQHMHKKVPSSHQRHPVPPHLVDKQMNYPRVEPMMPHTRVSPTNENYPLTNHTTSPTHAHPNPPGERPISPVYAQPHHPPNRGRNTVQHEQHFQHQEHQFHQEHLHHQQIRPQERHHQQHNTSQFPHHFQAQQQHQFQQPQQQKFQQPQPQPQQQENSLYIDQSFINNPGDSLDSGFSQPTDPLQGRPPPPPATNQAHVNRGGNPTGRQQSLPALVHNQTQHRQISEPSLPMHSTPQKVPLNESTHTEHNHSHQFSGGFERVPMSSSHSMDTLGSQSSHHQSGWDSDIDRLQQQSEISILNMQNMLTPMVEDEFQYPESSQQVNSSQMQDRAPPSTNKPPPVMPKPQVAPKPSKLQKSQGSQSNTKLNAPEFDPSSLAINKLRPSVPDLGQLTDMDPKKPKIKQSKVRRAVWEPRPMNRAIESSSDSESDTGSEYSVDSVLQPGDNTSLRSSHV